MISRAEMLTLLVGACPEFAPSPPGRLWPRSWPRGIARLETVSINGTIDARLQDRLY
jgi:hypothetical protein